MERLEQEQLVRDSIEIFHSMNFIKPRSEICLKRLPSVILIGVAKSGTKEIVDFLRLHPHIQSWHGTQSGYEMKYFDMFYERGSDWLRQQMPCSYSNQITVMKNALYFHNRLVPERIKKFNETVKLILLVREPSARSISALTFGRPRYKDTDKLNQDLSGMVKNARLKVHAEFPFLPTKLKLEDKVFKVSFYDAPMALWLRYFNRNQILVLESDEFKKKPAAVLNKVESFLGLDHYITPDMFVYNEEKHFYCIRSNFTDSGIACYADNRGRLFNISIETKRILRKFYEPMNKRFFDMIGETFDWQTTVS